MSKSVTEKIKELLPAEELVIFESSIEKMITDKVTDMVALREEELKKEYDSLAEAYVVKEVEKRSAEEKAKLVEEYDSKLTILENKIVGKIDSFFDHVISEQISDQMLEKIAINEALSPIVEGIKKVYSENFIQLNSDASVKLQESADKVKKLETQLSESMNKLMESEKRLEKTAGYLLISEKTQGMLPSEKDRVIKMFKGKNFEDVKQGVDTFVEFIKESKKTSGKVITESVKPSEKVVTKKKTLDESIDSKDNIDPKRFVDVPKVSKDETPTMSKSANKFL